MQKSMTLQKDIPLWQTPEKLASANIRRQAAVFSASLWSFNSSAIASGDSRTGFCAGLGAGVVSQNNAMPCCWATTVPVQSRAEPRRNHLRHRSLPSADYISVDPV
jgi:hypothetical protein